VKFPEVIEPGDVEVISMELELVGMRLRIRPNRHGQLTLRILSPGRVHAGYFTKDSDVWEKNSDWGEAGSDHGTTWLDPKKGLYQYASIGNHIMHDDKHYAYDEYSESWIEVVGLGIGWTSWETVGQSIVNMRSINKLEIYKGADDAHPRLWGQELDVEDGD